MRRFVFVLALIISAAFPAHAEKIPTNIEILRNLDTIIFGSEFVGQDSDRVRKWYGPMRVAVYGDDAGLYAALIDAHLRNLQILTRLDLQRVKIDDSEQNARVYFVDKRKFGQYAAEYLGKGKPGTNQNLLCFGVFMTRFGSQDIINFLAVIPVPSSPEEVKACIVEELTQILGLPNDSDAIHPTIFNDDNVYKDLTWLDELMVRVLYDPLIKAGMNQAEFEIAALEVLNRIRPEGRGDEAVVARAAAP